MKEEDAQSGVTRNFSSKPLIHSSYMFPLVLVFLIATVPTLSLPNFANSSLSKHSDTTLSAILNHTQSICNFYSNFIGNDGFGYDHNCMDGSDGFIVLTLALSMSLLGVLHMLLWSSILTSCIHFDKEQDPKQCNTCNYLSWMKLVTSAKDLNVLQSGPSKCIAACWLVVMVVCAIVFCCIANYAKGPCSREDSASLVVYIIMLILGVLLLPLAIACLCPCPRFGSKYPGVMEQMVPTPITRTLVDGRIIPDTVSLVTFYHYSLPYLKCFPLISILALHTAIPMLIMGVFGLLAHEPVKTTYYKEEHYYTTLLITSFGIVIWIVVMAGCEVVNSCGCQGSRRRR